MNGFPNIYTEKEIALIRESALLVGKTLGEVKKHIREGVSTARLDMIAYEFIHDHHAQSAFKGYRVDDKTPPFPATLCISINEEVVHGIPSENRILRNGDIVSVDCGVLMNGFYGDSAYTFGVGDISSEKRSLLNVTKESLYKGIENAIVGCRVGAISSAIQRYVEPFGYGVIQEITGHGVGRNLHEPPDVPNFGKKWEGDSLQQGMVIAIEPMITMGKRRISTAKDQWTLYTKDRRPAAHFEHTVAIREHKAEILSSFAYIEET